MSALRLADALEPSVCALAIQQTETFIIPNLTLDERTRDNALVTGEPFTRFYAGAVLPPQIRFRHLIRIAKMLQAQPYRHTSELNT